MSPTRDKLIRTLIGLCVANNPALQEKEMGPTVTLWNMMLNDIPNDVLVQAVKKHIATNKHFPSISEIREAAKSFSPNRVPTKEEAWDEVQRKMTPYSYGKTQWSHPLIGKTVETMGGLTTLCASEKPGVDRAHFFAIYEAFANRERDEEVCSAIKQLSANFKLVGGGAG